LDKELTVNHEIDRQLHALLQAEKAAYSPELPSATLVWWKAQITEKRRLQKKSLLPIQMLHAVSAAIVCLAAVGLLYAGTQVGVLLNSMAIASGSVLTATTILFIYWLCLEESSSFRNDGAK
jgi:hypothetical protein